MVVVIEHESSSPAGFLGEYLPHLVHQYGLGYQLLIPDQLQVWWEHEKVLNFRHVAALVVLGGSMNLDEEDRYPFLRFEKNILEKMIAQDIPMMGICLGAQLIAEQLGAFVGRLPYYELGWIPVWQGDEFQGYFMSWHGYGFDWPKDVDEKLWSVYHHQQGFRKGGIWCYQFHPEALKSFITETEMDLRTLERPNCNPVVENLWNPNRMLLSHIWLKNQIDQWFARWVLPRWRQRF